MKYYKVVVQIGHHGAGRVMDVPVFPRAENLVDAIAEAMKYPGVKHKKIPLTAKEISKEEFLAGRKEDVYGREMGRVKRGYAREDLKV